MGTRSDSILAGELGTMNLASVLQILNRSGNSGVVQLVRGEQKAEVAVDKGRILWARLNWGQRLGEALITRRRLTPDLCSMALRHQRTGRRRMPLGKVLVALGMATHEDVTREIERMTLRAMSEAILWDEGQYAVYPLTEDDQGIHHAAPIESILLALAA